MGTTTSQLTPAGQSPALTDSQRLDFLESLVGRHEMTPCWKSMMNPDGLRKDFAGSDAHVFSSVSFYIRDARGNAIVSAYGATWRETVDKAHAAFSALPNALDQTFRAVAHKAAPPRL